MSPRSGCRPRSTRRAEPPPICPPAVRHRSRGPRREATGARSSAAGGLTEPFTELPLRRRDPPPLAVIADEIDDLLLAFRERDLSYFIRQNSGFSEFY